MVHSLKPVEHVQTRHVSTPQWSGEDAMTRNAAVVSTLGRWIHIRICAKDNLEPLVASITARSLILVISCAIFETRK